MGGISGVVVVETRTVPIASTLALPAIQLGGFAILVAALPFVGLPLTPRWPLPRRRLVPAPV